MTKFYSKFCLSVIAVFITTISFSQNNDLVLNGAYIVLNGGTVGSPIYLDVNQSNAAGIVNLTPGSGQGGIISEKEFNQVKWEIGTSASGTYTVPFTYSTTNYIPLSMTVSAAGTGSGSIKFATYGDEPSANEWDNVNYQPSDLPANSMQGQCFTNDSKFVTDRFWIVDAAGSYTTNPTSSLLFTFITAENTAAGNDITAAKLQAQRFDAGAGTWWDWTAAKGTEAANTVNSGSIPAANLFRSWTLISPQDSVTNAGTTNTCSGTPITLSDPRTPIVSSSWSTSTNPTSVLATTNTISVSTSAKYTDTVTLAFGCRMDTATNVSISASPVITLTPTPFLNPDSICQGTAVTINASGGTGYSWNHTPAITTSSITITPVTTGDTVFQLSVSNASGCKTDSNITVNVAAPVTASAVSPVSFCSNDSVHLSSDPSGASYKYSWLPATGLSSASAQDPWAKPTANETYTVTVKNGACSSTANVAVTVNASPTISVSPTPNVTIIDGSTQNLTATSVSGNDTYSWAPANTLTGANTATPVASPTVTTWYTVTATNGSCTATDSVEVIVKENCGPIYLPTAFSPNGDNVNDVLKVYGNCIQDMTLNIYDRWGNNVFSSTNQADVWDGTFKGKAMNTATYVYYLTTTDINGVTLTKKGNVTLVR